ncbi:MAG: GNAT family N-acetyltransferase [Candidatus Omnitrophica bacterium]|nr:GNAT family N-acetyltransferase [Candidatus Omnitrophota bacterium]
MDLGNKIKIRQAELEDIPQILEVERAAWGKERAATTEMFKSRIKTFPEGTLVALIGNKIVGVVVTEIVNYDLDKNSFSWYEITDNGFIKKSHNSKGDTLYGVDLSVHPFYQNKGVGKKLMEAVGRLVIKYNLKRGALGARIPQYHKYAEKIKVENYIQIKDKNEKESPPDPELIFYQNLGLKIVKVIPNYFKDSESLNYGVLLVWENPFYNKWYRGIAAKFFKV